MARDLLCRGVRGAVYLRNHVLRVCCSKVKRTAKPKAPDVRLAVKLKAVCVDKKPRYGVRYRRLRYGFTDNARLKRNACGLVILYAIRCLALSR